MENKTMKIDMTLIGDDIVSCVKILKSTLIKEVDGNMLLADFLTKGGEATYPLLKAKAAAERLNVLLNEYAKE